MYAYLLTMRAYLIAGLVLCAAAAPAAAQPSPAQLVDAWGDANGNCRGSTRDETFRDEECGRRQAIRGRLNQIGWCRGKQGQSQAEMRWHRCTIDSIIPNDLEVSRPY